MRLFYGGVIVGVGMIVTCVDFGAMFSLGIFLQPTGRDWRTAMLVLGDLAWLIIPSASPLVAH